MRTNTSPEGINLLNMVTLNTNHNINKDYILQKCSQEQLYEFYIGDCIIGGRINSPLRKDDCPSFSLFYNKKGDIYWKDFGSGKYGGIWNLVMELYGLTYYQAIVQVYKDMILGMSPIQSTIDINSYKRERKSCDLFVDYRKLEDYDLDYWFNKYGINQRLLKLFNVYPIQRLYINNNVLWNNTKNKPIYQYLFSDKTFKCYSPMGNKGYKWSGNAKSNIIMGWDALPSGDLENLIITKSLKDVMVFRTLGYLSIAPIAEGVYFNDEQINLIKSKAKNIYVCCDFDYVGVRQTQYLRKFGFKYFFISTCRCDKSEKDVSDYLNKNGLNSTIELLNKLIKN